jgi:hypothetical protein
MNATPKHVIDCLKAGQITEAEADFYLREVHNTTLEQTRGVQRPHSRKTLINSR